MSDPVGAGIIGTAHSHARGHLEAIRQSANYTFIAAAEPHPDLLAKARSDPRWKDVKWVDVHDLLADKSIQMICIETDPLEALYYSLLSIEAGKHTKIDKPPGMNLGLLRKVYQESERRHLLVQMGYVFRYNAAFRLAQRAIQEGWLGPVESGYGFHLVRIDRRTPSRLPTFGEVRARVATDYDAQRRSDANERYYETLAAQYRIEIEIPATP